MPFSLDLMFWTAYPAIMAVAGLVPWAESGTRIFLRGLPWDSRKRAHQQDAGEFAVRAGGRLQRDRVHAGDFEHGLFEPAIHFHRALRELSGLVGMRPRHAFDTRHQFIHARVVLHGAGTERIQAEIDGVVPGGEAREVADHLHFADFGEVFDFRADVASAERLLRDRRRERPAPEADSRSCRASFPRRSGLRSGRYAGELCGSSN